MDGVTVEYEVVIHRLRRFGRRRFGLSLHADGIFTGVAYTGLTCEEAMNEAEVLVAEAADVLEFHGLSDAVASAVHEERGFRLAGVRPGDVVRLRRGAGLFGEGHRCEVLHVDLTEDWEALDDYPVTVKPLLSRAEVSLELDEFDLLRAARAA